MAQPLAANEREHPASRLERLWHAGEAVRADAEGHAGIGDERQLETALETALQLIERTGSGKPQFGERPDLRRSTLPPRR